MATPAQIAANRTNSTHSTGPVTDSGKHTASRNAVTHGMTSAKLIVPGEDPAAYEALLADTLARLAPQGEMERALAEEVAIAHWRHRRMLRYEAAFWHLQTDRVLREGEEHGADYDPDLVAAGFFTDPAEQRKVALVLRYVTAAERAYTKAVKAFEKAVATRPEQTEPATDAETTAEPRGAAVTHPQPANQAPPAQTARDEQTAPSIGFVSQNERSTPAPQRKAA